jgi:DNA-binding transcriptional MocR family regulator
MDYHQYRDAVFASDLTSNAKLVALVISYHYNWKKQQDAFVSNKTIARESSLSVRTVIRAKKELESKGYLVTKRQYNSANLSQPKCQEQHSNNEFNNEFNNVKIKDSNESLVIINNKDIQKGISENPSLAEVKAIAAAEDIWAVFESR